MTSATVKHRNREVESWLSETGGREKWGVVIQQV